LDVQHEVNQNQSIVTSLTEKFNNFQGYLAIADSKRAQALANKNVADQLMQSALDLQNNSAISFNEVVCADDTTKTLASQVTDVMNKLVYSAELMNKLSAFVIRKKALNPLISDELISVIGTAGNDANNAVALTLVALQSIFAAQASTIESEQAIALEFLQAKNLFLALTGITSDQIAKNGSVIISEDNVSLYALLYRAYDAARQNYETAKNALDFTTKQLNNAQSVLNKSQVALRSLQAGLAAANAAALAS
jgi:hypothetical protein